MDDRVHNIPLYLNTNPLMVDFNKLIDLISDELEVIRYLLDSNTDYGPITDAQRKGWLAFMNSSLDEKSHRIPFVQALTGNPMYTSTNHLTFGAISVLIEVCTEQGEKIHQKSGQVVQILSPSPWFSNVRPGIEHVITVHGSCPEALIREELRIGLR